MIDAISSSQNVSTLNINNGSQFSDVAIVESSYSDSKYYGKFTNQQMYDATDRLNTKENMAFLSILTTNFPPSTETVKRFAKAYINYINQLSPEDQNSHRYKGTKESMTALLSSVSTQTDNEQSTSGKKSKKATSDIVKMLEDMLKNFQEINNRTKSSAKETTRTDKVTISEAAIRNDGVKNE